MQLRKPIDPRTFVPPDKDERSEEVVLGCIESRTLAHHFGAKLHGRVERKSVPQLTLNLNLNLQLPPGFDPKTLQQDAQKILQEMLAAIQGEVQKYITQQVRDQMPISNYKMWTQDGAWSRVTNWRN